MPMSRRPWRASTSSDYPGPTRQASRHNLLRHQRPKYKLGMERKGFSEGWLKPCLAEGFAEGFVGQHTASAFPKAGRILSELLQTSTQHSRDIAQQALL